MTTYRVTFSAIVDAKDEESAIEEAEKHLEDHVAAISIEEYHDDIVVR